MPGMGQPRLNIGGGVKLASSFTLGRPQRLSKKGLKGIPDRQLVQLAERGHPAAINEAKRRIRHGRHLVVRTRVEKRIIENSGGGSAWEPEFPTPENEG